MLQAIIKKGKVQAVEVPSPLVTPGHVLIQTIKSCISAGTELSSVAASSKNLIQRALEQPEQVKEVLNRVRDEGIEKTYSKLKAKLNLGSPVGYSLSGIVAGVGEGVDDFKTGEHVAAAGAGIANHAEVVDVPRNLVMAMPATLDFSAASTVALGGIALQGVRRANIQLGEFIVVFGAGILGQMAIQMAALSGARVAAIDINPQRLNLARKLGAEIAIHAGEQDPVQAVLHMADGHGADAVIFCAAAQDGGALSSAFAMTRKKGRVVMVGTYGDVLHRSDIYAKEIDFLISTSYGPGRYDANYEEKGLDYPFSHVRWTENRNMREYLRLLAEKKITVDTLIESVYPIERVESAFQHLQSPERPLIVLLDYGADLPGEITKPAIPQHKIEIKPRTERPPNERLRVGLIGAGSFAADTHLPNLQKLKKMYAIHGICDHQGAKAESTARHYGAKYATSDYRDILKDPNIDLVMICTRHHLHGKMVLESLQAGKSTFVEKPLCTRPEELEAIRAFYEGETDRAKPPLFVGFNRRFSKYAREIRKLADQRVNPMILFYRMNAGYLPLDHWVHTEEGGGRMIGEACHIVDLFSFIINSSVKSYSIASIRPSTDSIHDRDNKCITFEYVDGSVATLQYFAVGARELAKEYLEAHFDGKSIILDNYQRMRGYGIKMNEFNDKSPQKGALEELEEIHSVCVGNEGQSPVEFGQIYQTTQITMRL
jgi:predicted dehydrogenase/threonine dehydrogenase-like Zn-dependent dehydrogenase